ncbi:MAG: YqgE/AlgH family protein [Chitinispirillales bacterium]|jgi:putative transcriptional regulator|nr:YqgE/AlgH family protein [Chitinispirillales bacterium]
MIWVKGENPFKIDLGTILVASPEIDDEYFKNSLILISAISPDSVLGFIINRPIIVPVKELFDNIDKRFHSAKRRIFAGGPVEESDLNIISFSLVGGREIVQGIRLGGHWKTLDEMLDSDEYENRLFMGYASWGINQLIDEIVLCKSWVVYNDVPVILAFAGVDNEEMQTSQQAISYLNVLAKR